MERPLAVQAPALETDAEHRLERAVSLFSEK